MRRFGSLWPRLPPECTIVHLAKRFCHGNRLPPSIALRLDRLVYQGPSGRVYPMPFRDSVGPAKTPRLWRAIHLEDEFVRLMLLPESGLVGLAGPGSPAAWSSTGPGTTGSGGGVSPSEYRAERKGWFVFLPLRQGMVLVIRVAGAVHDVLRNRVDLSVVSWLSWLISS